jgi:prophage maintenance system killer protein
MIWINMQVTKKTLPFNYAKLEEATFNQYGYGNSASVMNQAARVLSGFTNKKPFTNGNEAAAFIATMAFLKMNGFKVSLSDETATHWIERASKDSSVATEALTDITSPDESYHEDEEPRVRDVVHDVMDTYPKTLSLLSHSRSLVGV